MSSCDICLDLFDHSIHKPSVLICGHTFCLSCLKKLNKKQCPTCNKQFIEVNSNTAQINKIECKTVSNTNS